MPSAIRAAVCAAQASSTRPKPYKPANASRPAKLLKASPPYRKPANPPQSRHPRLPAKPRSKTASHTPSRKPDPTYQKLAAYLKKYKVEAVVMEATGIYYLDAAVALHNAGIPISVINPHTAAFEPGQPPGRAGCPAERIRQQHRSAWTSEQRRKHLLACWTLNAE